MADPEYDPVARRERYLRERQLLGPRKRAVPTVGTEGRHQPKGPKDKEDKKGRSSARAAASKAVSEAHRKDVEKIKTAANARKEAISAKLQEVLQKLNTEKDIKQKALEIEKEKKLADIAADKEAKLAAIPDIPSNASPALYASIQKRRSKAIRKINGEANEKAAAVKDEHLKKLSDVNTEADKVTTFVREVTRAQQDQARSDLTKSIEGAKQRYETLKKGLGPTE